MTRGSRCRCALAALVAFGTSMSLSACGVDVAATAAPHSTTSPKPAKTPTPPNTSENWVSVGQTVLAATDSTGKTSGKPRVFTQLIANGTKPATVTVPMSSAGFRNLLGFSEPPIRSGKAVWNLHLSGQTKERTVADFATRSLPLTVAAKYELNGRVMKATNIVGKSGTLKATYTIRNITSRPTTVTFKNVLGQMQTVTKSTPVPIAAAFSITFPASFTNLSVPKASTYGLGDAKTSASWTLFTFKPLGDLTQTVSYEAHVTDATIPSATLEAEVIPPKNLSSLPTIHEPQAPVVPTVTVGVHLQELQQTLNKKLTKISASASNLLHQFQAVAASAATKVSDGAAKLAAKLTKLAAAADQVSTSVGDVASRMSQHASALAQIAGAVASVQANVAALPTELCNSLQAAKKTRSLSPSACAQRVSALPHFQLISRQLATVAGLIVTLSTDLNTTTKQIQRLQSQLATTMASDLTTASGRASGLSQQASALASSISQAMREPRKKRAPRQVPTKQIGGGKRLDAAVHKLDDAINTAAGKVDAQYANLTALDTRSGKSLLPAGNATGATVQAGLVIYSISGADRTQHQIHLAAILGATAITLGATFGLSLYRIRRGWPSSLAPPKKH